MPQTITFNVTEGEGTSFISNKNNINISDGAVVPLTHEL